MLDGAPACSKPDPKRKKFVIFVVAYKLTKPRN